MVEGKNEVSKKAKASGSRSKLSAQGAAASEASSVGSAVEEKSRGLRKKREGLVISNKMDKTVVVAVVSQVKHPGYGKYVRRTSRYYAHDEASICGVGDRVRIVETRPLSKLKRWRVESVLTKAE